VVLFSRVTDFSAYIVAWKLCAPMWREAFMPRSTGAPLGPDHVHVVQRPTASLRQWDTSYMWG